MDELKYGDRLVRDRWSWLRAKHAVFRFRIGSVPGVHHRRYHCGDSYRYPHTKAELSNGYIADGDEEFLTAAQEYKLTKVRDLPVAWDEIPRHSRRNCSWKRFRDTQYHGVLMGSVSLR